MYQKPIIQALPLDTESCYCSQAVAPTTCASMTLVDIVGGGLQPVEALLYAYGIEAKLPQGDLGLGLQPVGITLELATSTQFGCFNLTI